MAPRKYVLDTKCFVDASRDAAAREAFEAFCGAAAPRLYLSAVVAAELLAGARTARERARLRDAIIEPYLRRARVVTPSASSWGALGNVLSHLVERDGLRLAQTPKSFLFDILIAHSCREAGAVLVSANARDLARIATVFAFDFVAPFPLRN